METQTEPVVTPPPEEEVHVEPSTNSAIQQERTMVSAPLRAVWDMLIPKHIQHIFVPDNPESGLFEGEELELEIHLAWYRNITAELVYRYPIILLVLAIALSAICGMLAINFGYEWYWPAVAPFAGLIAMAFYALYERFDYLQWRLVKTNKRIILSMPQPDAWYLVDNIELNGNPKVIDTNWSDNQVWRAFQMMTGARDLYISIVGFQFVEGSSKVKDALLMPDVLLEDAEKLKALVYTKK